ncbi:MAG: dihydrofolate reductase [Myxococcota bacterium]
MKLVLVAAMTQTGVIGRAGQMPWHISAEFAHFKRVTMGKPMIMGRKTFESLGGKTLPGREMIVVSRHGLSLQEALEQKSDAPEVIIAGGSEIYAQCLPLASHMILSIIKKDYPGDVYFPAYEPSEWELTQEDDFEEFRVRCLQRVQAPGMHATRP